MPPAGFDDYFGPGPLYRFIDFDGVSELDDITSKLREIPQGLTAEDAMRRLIGNKQSFHASSVRNTLNSLIGVLDLDSSITVRFKQVLMFNESYNPHGILIGNTWIL